MVLAENITNNIAKIIQESVDIENLCQEKFSKSITGEDNLIYIDALAIAPKPSFTVTKLPTEKHYFNRGTESGLESEWQIMVSFFGDFGAGQLLDDGFRTPEGARVDVNGITTYTPSDTMRIIARLAGQAVNKKIGCIIPGVLVESFDVDAEDYYDATNGEVKSFVKIDLYKKSSIYNN